MDAVEPDGLRPNEEYLHTDRTCPKCGASLALVAVPPETPRIWDWEWACVAPYEEYCGWREDEEP